jgi:thiamine-phosphate pyrophosphorylase
VRLHALVSDLETARRAADGGATVIQLRLKGATREEIVGRGAGFRELGPTFIVNDDVQAAIMLDADGVHLGREDPGSDEALAAGLILGRSASSVEEAKAAQAEGASYVGAGPVWSTPSKPDADPAIGLDGLREICEAVSTPVVAIGGIDVSNARACIEAGAAGIAVVRAAERTAELSAAL